MSKSAVKAKPKTTCIQPEKKAKVSLASSDDKVKGIELPKSLILVVRTSVRKYEQEGKFASSSSRETVKTYGPFFGPEGKREARRKAAQMERDFNASDKVGTLTYNVVTLNQA